MWRTLPAGAALKESSLKPYLKPVGAQPVSLKKSTKSLEGTKFMTSGTMLLNMFVNAAMPNCSAKRPENRSQRLVLELEELEQLQSVISRIKRS